MKPVDANMIDSKCGQAMNSEEEQQERNHHCCHQHIWQMKPPKKLQEREKKSKTKQNPSQPWCPSISMEALHHLLERQSQEHPWQEKEKTKLSFSLLVFLWFEFLDGICERLHVVDGRFCVNFNRSSNLNLVLRGRSFQMRIRCCGSKNRGKDVAVSWRNVVRLANKKKETLFTGTLPPRPFRAFLQTSPSPCSLGQLLLRSQATNANPMPGQRLGHQRKHRSFSRFRLELWSN